MNPSEKMKIINFIEKSFPVQEWLIEGFRIWPIVRSCLFISLTDSNREVLNSKNNILKDLIKSIINHSVGVSEYACGYIRDYKNNDNWNDLADVVFYTQNIRRIYFDFKWYDRYCDPFIEFFDQHNLKSLVFECAPQYKYQTPRCNKSVFVQPYLDYAAMKSKFLAGNKLFELEGYNNFVEFLESQNINVHAMRIERHISLVREMANLFKKKLKKVNPSLCLVLCYAGIDGMAFTLACSELGIPCVDIQHGYLGELNYAYGRWNNIPEEGYELLPDLFWCWGKEEKLVIDQWATKCSTKHQAIVGGDLWQKFWKNGNKKLIDEYDRRIIKLIGRDNAYKKNILVTLQNGFPCPDFLLEAIKSSPKNWQWWIRLHPIMLGEKEKIRMLFGDCRGNIEIDFSSELPLLALLRHADVHVTRFSTSVLEAEAFGVPSVLVDSIGVEYYPEQVRTGLAISAYTSEEVLSSITKQILHKEKISDIAGIDSSKFDNEAMEFLLSCINSQRLNSNIDGVTREALHL